MSVHANINFDLMVSGKFFEDGVNQQVDKHHTTLNEELLETWWGAP